jgi:hypothetical protein
MLCCNDTGETFIIAYNCCACVILCRTCFNTHLTNTQQVIDYKCYRRGLTTTRTYQKKSTFSICVLNATCISRPSFISTYPSSSLLNILSGCMRPTSMFHLRLSAIASSLGKIARTPSFMPLYSYEPSDQRSRSRSAARQPAARVSRAMRSIK